MVTFDEICGVAPGGKLIKTETNNPYDCGKFAGFVQCLNDLRDGCVYRLPTEEEYEFATRAGTQTAYFSGSDPRSILNHAWIGDHACDVVEQTSVNGSTSPRTGVTHPVATKRPNPFGLYDMVGNVSAITYSNEGDGSGHRVIRGGNYCAPVQSGRSAARMSVQITQGRSPQIGFRLVRVCQPNVPILPSYSLQYRANHPNGELDTYTDQF